MSIPSDEARVALVTGGARRVGLGITRALQEAGWRVGVGYHGSREEAEGLEAADPQIRAVRLDVTDDASVREAVAAAREAWGRLDLVVNNAGWFPSCPLPDLTVEHWQAVLDLNLTGPLRVALAAREALRASRGCLVNITDVYARRPLPDHTAYCVSKAGLWMLTRSLALELAPEVRVNAVSPGPIVFPEGTAHAEMRKVLSRTPLGRSGSPADIGRAVLYLANATYVTGDVLVVDGGRSAAAW